MEFLLDPNVAYLLLAGGLIFAVLAILNPGTGLIEVLALIGLLVGACGAPAAPAASAKTMSAGPTFVRAEMAGTVTATSEIMPGMEP